MHDTPAFACGAWTCLSRTPPLARSSRGDRVAIGRSSYQALQRRAAGYKTSASRLGALVLDEYLARQEVHLFGAARASRVLRTAPAMRAVDAAIFDMDGVLCDSEEASRVCGAAVLRDLYGVEASADEFSAFTGMGEGRFLGGVAELHGVKDFDEEKAKLAFFEKYVRDGFLTRVTAYPGIPGLISRLRDAGLSIGVASAADAVKVQANLKAIRLDADGVFDFVTSSDDIENKKPAPDVFLAAAKGLGVDPARCVVMEDAVAGVQAAKAAGMRCVAVATSMPEDALGEAGADLVRVAPAGVSLEDMFGEPLANIGEAEKDTAEGAAAGSEA